MYLYEIWYDFYDGTQERIDCCRKKVKTFIDKKMAWNTLRELNAKCEFHNPYFLKKVKK